MPDLDVVAAVLITGSLLFFVGAGLAPEPDKVFSSPLGEYLEIIARNRARWALMNSLMIASVVVTTIGLVLLARLLYGAGDGYRATSAAVAYAVVGVQWSLSLAFRQTAVVAVAEGVAGGAAIPDWLEPLQRWTGLMYWTYMLVAYISMAVFGWSFLHTGAAGDPFGWFAVVFGAVAAAGFATGLPRTAIGPLFEPPFLAHVVPFVLGIALLT